MRSPTKIGIALSVLLVSGAVAQARDLTATSWGGAFQEIQNDVYFNPFRKETGIPLIDETWNGGVGVIRTMVEAGNPTWDLLEVEDDELLVGCEEGLFEKLDFSRIGGKERYLEAAVTPCGIATTFSAFVLGYDKDKLKDPPQSWADFFDTAKFPGRRALRSGPKSTLEFALLADGVPPEQIYEVLATEEGVDRAFKKLDSIKGDLIFWTASAQAPQWLASGEVVMTSSFNGRLDAANLTDNRNFGIVWNQSIRNMDSWVILKGSPNIDAAYKLLDYMGDPARQAALAERIAYGGSNKDANGLLPPDRVNDLVTSEENAKVAIPLGVQFWVDNIDRLTERFNQWAAN